MTPLDKAFLKAYKQRAAVEQGSAKENPRPATVPDTTSNETRDRQATDKRAAAAVEPRPASATGETTKSAPPPSTSDSPRRVSLEIEATRNHASPEGPHTSTPTSSGAKLAAGERAPGTRTARGRPAVNTPDEGKASSPKTQLAAAATKSGARSTAEETRASAAAPTKADESSINPVPLSSAIASAGDREATKPTREGVLAALTSKSRSAAERRAAAAEPRDAAAEPAAKPGQNPSLAPVPAALAPALRTAAPSPPTPSTSGSASFEVVDRLPSSFLKQRASIQPKSPSSASPAKSAAAEAGDDELPPILYRFDPPSPSPVPAAHTHEKAPSMPRSTTTAERFASRTETATVAAEPQDARSALAAAAAAATLPVASEVAGRPAIDAAEEDEALAGPATIPLLRPALAIEGLRWPPLCDRLNRTTAHEMDRLCDGLLVGLARGQKVIGFAGVKRGEGATTVLLCAARRLADRGVRAVVVDADARNPQIAERLGLSPEAGWDAVLAGQHDLAEVLLEVPPGDLVFLPLRSASELQRASTESLRATIATLAANYDLVLADVGAACEDAGAALDARLVGQLDAAVLIQDQRRSDDEDVDAAVAAFETVGVPTLGVVENFVRDAR